MGGHLEAVRLLLNAGADGGMLNDVGRAMYSCWSCCDRLYGHRLDTVRACMPCEINRRGVLKQL